MLCVGYLGEMIQAIRRRRAGVRAGRGIFVRRAELLGTAGAIRRALPLLGDAFSVIYGDSYLPCDYARALAAFRDSGKLGLMTVYRNEGHWDTSNVEFAGGRILAYDKANRTPPCATSITGWARSSAAAFEDVPAGPAVRSGGGLSGSVAARRTGGVGIARAVLRDRLRGGHRRSRRSFSSHDVYRTVSGRSR